VAASVTTAETTSATTYGNLTTLGPAQTVTVPADGKVLLSVASGITSSTGSTTCFMSYAISGATTIAAADVNAVQLAGGTLQRASAASVQTGLPPGGSITVTAQYRSSGPGTCTFSNRTLIVMPLP
jgi:hypothetical protein